MIYSYSVDLACEERMRTLCYLFPVHIFSTGSWGSSPVDTENAPILAWLHGRLGVFHSAGILRLNLRKSPSVSSHLSDVSPHVCVQNLTASALWKRRKKEWEDKPAITEMSLHETSDTDPSIKTRLRSASSSGATSAFSVFSSPFMKCMLSACLKVNSLKNKNSTEAKSAHLKRTEKKEQATSSDYVSVVVSCRAAPGCFLFFTPFVQFYILMLFGTKYLKLLSLSCIIS